MWCVNFTSVILAWRNLQSFLHTTLYAAVAATVAPSATSNKASNDYVLKAESEN